MATPVCDAAFIARFKRYLRECANEARPAIESTCERVVDNDERKLLTSNHDPAYTGLAGRKNFPVDGR